jgi:hypothetical protein
MRSDFTFSLDLPVRSEWANVDLVRSSVQNCFTAVFQNVDGCHAIAMVTGELLENAIKYGDWTTGKGSFRLRVWGEGGAANVSVESPVKPGDEHIASLFKTLEWLASFPSAEDAYRAKLLQIAEAPRDGASSLGLARIAYEGNCKLEASLDGEIMKVTAKMVLA